MTLQEVCEVSWRQIFPSPRSQTSVTKEEFISTGKNEWAYQTWLAYLNEKNLEGYADVPSYLLDQTELPVVGNVMDISSLQTFKSLPQEVWLQQIGGGNCKCKYIKSTVNLSQLLCDDDSVNDGDKTYYVLGKKIVFPKGTHATPLTITYASRGNNISNTVEIDEAIAALVRQRLNDIYLGKVAQVDTTNNNNSNT